MTRGQVLFYILVSIAFAAAFAYWSPAMLQWVFQRMSMALAPSGSGLGPSNDFNSNNPFSIGASSLLGLILGATAARLLIGVGGRWSVAWENMDTGDKVTVFIGIFVGLIASMPFLLLLNSLQLGVYIPFAVIGLTIGFAAVSIFALRSMEDILPWSRGRGPVRRRGIKILDTNVLIDGRIYDVARAGFLEGQIYVPGFVLEELQFIADSSDPLRRQRGRRGLDVLRHLQAEIPVEVKNQDRQAPDMGDPVDARLIRLARALGADIVTNDFNLNRVASLQNVKVLNLNDLALAMRSNVLPSETMHLSIVREGNQVGQGIGYMEDGTMVVVENGKAHIGESLDVVVTQVIQTERGKMIFATLADEHSSNGAKRPRK